MSCALKNTNTSHLEGELRCALWPRAGRGGAKADPGSDGESCRAGRQRGKSQRVKGPKLLKLAAE